jgi:tetratricopeptide (TPR) repeat protein
MQDETPQMLAHKAYQDGCAAHARGNRHLAYDSFLRAIELDPNVSAYRLNLAITAQALARPADQLNDLAYFQASECCRIQPEILGNWVGFADVAMLTHHYKEAIHAYEQALQLVPENARLWCLLGFVHHKLDHIEDAKACYLKSVELDPEQGQPHFLLTTVYTGKDYDPARIAYHGEQAFTVKHKATLALEAMWNAAHGFLGIGCYEKGWGYFEARLHRNITNQGHPLLGSKFKKPMWKGERNCTVCIFSEMGLGDIFIMLRYFPIIEKQFKVSIIFEGSGSYLDLVAHNFPNVKCTLAADDNDFDYHLPIMSLPFICKTRADSVPWSGPYLKAEPAKIEQWANGPWADKSMPNVGLCWSTGVNAYNPHNYDVHKKKSVPFEMLNALLGVPGVRLVSLQTGSEEERMPNPGIKTFSDTAAILHHLDGVITVDTALANLAGAMGVKTYLFGRFDSDWRYEQKLKTPWYPTVVPYRQKVLNEWSPVISSLIDEMENLAPSA